MDRQTERLIHRDETDRQIDGTDSTAGVSVGLKSAEIAGLDMGRTKKE